MSTSTHQIVLTARDGTQQVFSAIEQGAKKDAAALQEMGQKGSASLKQVDQSATQAASGAEKFNRAWAAAGAVAGVASGLLSDWSRSAQDAAAIQRQLEQAITNTGHSFDEYADQIQQAQEHAIQLGIDDEKAAQAIQALTEITGSAQTALDLLGTAEDVSAAKGMDLVSAAELIGKVHEGNTSILQRYGIVVQQGATAEEALAAIQQQTAGQAEAHATTYARLREELSNVTDSIGGAVGGFAPFVAMLPGLSIGVTTVTTAIGALIPEMTAAGAASAALDLALGPAGIVLAAGAAAVAIYELGKQTGEFTDWAEEAETASDGLAASIATLTAAGNANATTFAAWGTTLQGALAGLNDEVNDLIGRQQVLVDQFGKNAPGIAELNQQIEDLSAVAAEPGPVLIALDEVIRDTGTGAELAQKAVSDLFAQYAAGTIGAGALAGGIYDVGTHLQRYDEQANAAAKSTNDLQRAFQGLPPTGAPGFFDSLTEKVMGATAATQESTDATVDNTQAVDDWNRKVREQWGQTLALSAANTENAFSLRTVFDASLKTADALGAQADAQAQLNATTITIPDVNAAADALNAQVTALDRIAAGSTTARDALGAFKEVQDGLIGSEQVFSAQASEYSQQVNAMTAAHDILAQRQADGIDLTKEQTDFMNNYDEALGRAQGGVEDATVAQGLLAEQYALNMKKGDELNSSLDGVNKTTGELTSAIELLIASLLGIPPETVADILMEGGDDALNTALDLQNALRALDGMTAHTYIENVTNNTTTNTVRNVGGEFGFATGGLVAAGGRMVTVNEGGQETATLPSGNTVWLPSGSTVWPHAASVEGTRGGTGRPMAFYHATINVYANDPQEFAAGLQAHQLGWSRR